MDIWQAIIGKGESLSDTRSQGQSYLKHPSRETLAGRCDAGEVSPGRFYLVSMGETLSVWCLMKPTSASHGLPALCAHEAQGQAFLVFPTTCLPRTEKFQLNQQGCGIQCPWSTRHMYPRLPPFLPFPTADLQAGTFSYLHCSSPSFIHPYISVCRSHTEEYPSPKSLFLIFLLPFPKCWGYGHDLWHLA